MSETGLEIDVLGPLQLRVGGTPVAVPGPRRRAVLALLAVSAPDVVPADALVDAIWGDEPPDSARNSMQSQISRLRRHLGPLAGRLTRQGPGYRLQLDPDELDVDRVRVAVAEAAQHRATGDPAAAVAPLRHALSQWRGDALAEFAEVAPLAVEAVALAERRAALIDELTEVLLDAGSLDAAVEHGCRAAADAPLREASQLLAMRALARTGRAAEALRLAGSFRERLAHETGLDPSPALTGLEHAIAVGEPSGPGPAPAVPGAPADPSTAGRVARDSPGAASGSGTGGPAPVTRPSGLLPLLGREEEQRELADLLTSERLVMLLGPGGVGKTRLAQELAAGHGRLAGFVELDTVDDGTGVLPAVAVSLDLRTAAPDGLLESCVDRLGAADGLLVVDNCEHVLQAARDLVAALLARCPRLVVLATSREPLDLPEERLFRLGPLPVPEPGTVAGDGTFASVSLFAARAARVAPGFRLDPSSSSDVSEICRRLDGLPLALELAAGRVGTLGLRTLCDRMDRVLDVAVGGRARGGAGRRHANLENLVRWSYDLLDDDEATLLRHLSLFVGGFDLPVAEQVAHALGQRSPILAVSHLIEASLVSTDGGDPPRCTMLNTIRAFGEAELDRHGEHEAAADLLIRWAVELCEDVDRRYYSHDQSRLIASVLGGLANLRAAHRLALERDDLDALASIVTGLHHVTGWAMVPELFEWARDLADDDRIVGRPYHPVVLAAGARAAWRQGALDDLERLSRTGLEVAVRPEDRRACLDTLAVAALFGNRFDEAAALWLDQDGGPNGPDVTASAALAIGYGGDPERAIELARRAVADAVALGAKLTEAFSRYCLGELLIGVDDGEAAANLRRAVELDPPTLAGFAGGVAHLTLVTLWQRHGDHEAALGGYHELVQRWQRAGSRTQLWTTLRNLAFLLAQLDEGPTALLLITRAAESPSAPDMSAEEGARLDQLRSALEETHGPVRSTEADVVAVALAAIDRQRFRTG